MSSCAVQQRKARTECSSASARLAFESRGSYGTLLQIPALIFVRVYGFDREELIVIANDGGIRLQLIGSANTVDRHGGESSASYGSGVGLD